MRIAIDVMGGDLGPAEIVLGAVEGAKTHNVGIHLVGDVSSIRAALDGADTTGVDYSIVPAADVITMDDHAAQAVRRKKDASMNVAMRLVKDGEAAAMLGPGNSGAMMASALMTLGRIKGIDRPAITSAMPNGKGTVTMMVDLGAVTDPKPINMVQQAIMGQIYAQTVVGIPHPTTGLLSVGSEDSKGNQLVLTVHQMLRATDGLNFHGNVEGKDIMRGTVDVVVTDGFTGNVALKAIEGTAAALMGTLKQELTSSLPRKLAAAVLKPAFRAVGKRLDPNSIGGAPLLGVDGVVIITHGGSNAEAIANAVGVAKRSVEQDLTGKIRDRVAAEDASDQQPE